MDFNEANLSQLPAMRILHNLGWEYISRQDVRTQREGNSNFLLSSILKEQLTIINEHKFKEQDINSAILELRPTAGDLLDNNIKIYRQLVRGTDIDVMDDSGSSAFIPFKYIDWDNYDNNKFHFTCEFDASEGRQRIILDIVLFINGIPIAAIECKRPAVELRQACNQLERYQRLVPGLFSFVQLVSAINKDAGKYSATGVEEARWSIWREEKEDDLGFALSYMNKILEGKVNEDSLEEMVRDIDSTIDISNQAERKGGTASKQNTLLTSLFNRERFLDLLRNFVIVGRRSKKMALAHQYFVVKNALVRVEERKVQGDENSMRYGGVVWHTQGSGKSTSMLLLIKNLKRHLGEKDPRVILVTDRLELNDQMKDNLKESDIRHTEPRNGKKLTEIITNTNEPVVLTNVHKFGKASEYIKEQKVTPNQSTNIFLLVDECHRTQYGEYARDMRLLIPNGCYIGFTGTPLLAKEQEEASITFKTFGEFIQPVYPIRRALEDGTIVPLYYEGRDFNIDIAEIKIDNETAEAIGGLDSVEERAIKRKFSDVFTLRMLQSIVEKIGEDIANHYARSAIRSLVPPEDIKAQLVVASKAHAVLYHRALRENSINSRVIISPPGQDDDDEGLARSINRKEARDLVNKFWEEEVVVEGRSAKEYERDVISKFKGEDRDRGNMKDEPQILVVVDKLITGFDAPKNTILYLCKSLKDHTLLQAIARVNRTYPKKKRGYIVDYNMTFENLKKALNEYDELGGYSSDDLMDTLVDISRLQEKFEVAYERIKEFLGGMDNLSTEEKFDAVMQNLTKTGNEDNFQQAYKEFMELLSKLSPVGSFINEYKDSFKELDGYIKTGAQLNKLLTQNKRGKRSADYYEAERLMQDVLNESLEANNFSIMGKRLPMRLLRHYKSPENKKVEEEHPEYIASKTGSGSASAGYGGNSFIRYVSHLKDLDRQNKDLKDSDPQFSEKMSELIRKALEECEQMALDFSKQTTTLKEGDGKDSKFLDKKFEELKKKFDRRELPDAPAGLKDNRRAYEYYYIFLNLLAKEKINVKEMEEEICAASEAAHEILEGQDNQGWCNNIDQEKKVRFSLIKKIWVLDTKYEDFPTKKDTELADKMMDIARARTRETAPQDTINGYS